MIEQTTNSKPATGFFTAHPASVGETYFEHMRFAFGISGQLFGAALAAAIHGLLPGLFESTANRTIKKLNGKMENRH